MSMKKKLGQIISSKSSVKKTYQPPAFVGNDQKPTQKKVPVTEEEQKGTSRKSVDIL